jgi:hypothetical protein
VLCSAPPWNEAARVADAIHAVHVAIARDDNTGRAVAERGVPLEPGMIAAADKVLAWSMIWVPSTPLELARPCGMASLAN